MNTQSSPIQSAVLPERTSSPTTPRKTHRGLKLVGFGMAALAVTAVAAQDLVHSATAQNPHAVAQATSWNSTSDNWSGYAETTAQTGQRYTEASAEWTVPAVATLPSSNGAVGCAALWTGIGGATSKDLIQLGTSSCSNSSETGYSAWYEILPAAETIVPSIQIEPGDRVFASLQLVSGSTSSNSQEATATYQNVVQLLHKFDPSFGSTDVIERLRQLLAEGQARFGDEPWWPALTAELHELFGSTSSSSAQVWKLSFQVTSPNGAVQDWTKTISYASSLSSVEWITEAPTGSSGVEPLPNYGVAHFIGISADAATPGFSPSNQIVLGDPHGEASVPSAPVGNADAFNTCYFPTFHITSCPDPRKG
jgi:hypothetical protein